MLAFAPAALLFLVFCVSVLLERRKFSNAVVLGLAVLCALGALLYRLVSSESPSVPYVVGALAALGAVALLVLVCFLFLNGVRMLRKEGRSPSNLLSLLAALAILGVVALLVTA
ncbi:YdcF family protein, partial [Streptomyces sp. MBT60]|nr:YdcF family protein [Streptomyces sp. MBT60]